jgi:multidrug resistance efflux pump
VPVRISIDNVPPGVPLVSGMTATVTVRRAEGTDDGSWVDAYARNSLSDFRI